MALAQERHGLAARARVLRGHASLALDEYLAAGEAFDQARTSAARAGSSEASVEALIGSVENLIQQERLDEAERQAALAWAEIEGRRLSPRRRHEFEMALGRLMVRRGHHAEAEDHFSRAAAVLPPDAPGRRALVLETMVPLGKSLLLLGRVGEAKAMWKRALEGLAELRGAGHPQVLTLRLNLAYLTGREGDHETAAAELAAVLAAQERTLGFDSPRLASTLVALANSLGILGQREAALAHLRRAQVLSRNHLRNDHGLNILIGLELAHYAAESGQLDAAEAELRRIGPHIDPRDVEHTTRYERLRVRVAQRG